MIQRAVIGQHQQTFTVAIQPTRGVNAVHINKVTQTGPRLRVTKLTQHIKGFVEKQSGSHGCI